MTAQDRLRETRAELARVLRDLPPGAAAVQPIQEARSALGRAIALARVERR